MSEQPPRPTSNDDREGWKAYWTAQGMPWRTEPEIDEERQRYLAERRAVKPDVEKGIYPFRDETGGIKLTRADVEWLLATHESGGLSGPVWWTKEGEVTLGPDSRFGLDLRGADLSEVNLSALPLARTIAGRPHKYIWEPAINDEEETAAADFRNADLSKAHLEGAVLYFAKMEHSILREAYLDEADLGLADLEHAYLSQARLKNADLSFARLSHAYLWRAQLDGANLSRSRLDFSRLAEATVSHADLSNADLRSATLSEANFGSADLSKAQLQGTDLSQANLHGADLSGVRMDIATDLEEASLDTNTCLADITWNNASLLRIAWDDVHCIGDERRAQRRTSRGGNKGKAIRLREFEAASRAYLQLAVTLRAQGLNQPADRFSYRAQLLQRRVFRLQRHYLRAIGSWLLDLVSGYGYRPLRAFFTYFVVVGAFAGVYALLAHFGLTTERFGS